MYPPPHHQIQDKEKMIEVIRTFGLGMVVTSHEGKPMITHIPVIFDEESGRLVTHIDSTNPQVESLKNGKEVTVVFHGPNTYISPSVYVSEQLPTWNYIIVHISGKIIEITDPEAVKKSLIKMASRLEGPEQRFVLKEDNPKMNRLVDYIRGFEVEIESWEGKFKLSQDKHPRDQRLTKAHMLSQWHNRLHDFIERMHD